MNKSLVNTGVILALLIQPVVAGTRLPACRQELSLQGKAILDRALPAYLAGVELRQAISDAAKDLVFDGSITMRDAPQNAQAAAACIAELQR